MMRYLAPAVCILQANGLTVTCHRFDLAPAVGTDELGFLLPQRSQLRFHSFHSLQELDIVRLAGTKHKVRVVAIIFIT